MEYPEIQGYQIQRQIGSGISGAVYQARGADGKSYAVKVFEAMASNTTLLMSRIERVRSAAWQNVTVPIVKHDLTARPAYVVMPYFEKDLQLQLAEYLGPEHGEKSWDLVLRLAAKISHLHAGRIAHGNLKPGHVMFDQNEELFLTDYASGLMPEIHRLNYSDAFLYAAPEQLRDPESYLNEEGYRWDVYAFGVIAFRLLNGIFPRCEDLFQKVSPAPGAKESFNIEVDLEGIAQSLEQGALAPWTDEAKDEAEIRRRHIIESCLALNPLERPSDMITVQHSLEVIAGDLEQEAEVQRILTSEKKAHRQKKLVSGLAKVLLLTALGLGGMWMWTQQQRMSERSEAQKNFDELRSEKDALIGDLQEEVSRANDSEKAALESEKKIQASLDLEQSKSRAVLSSAQLTNDQLFRWILEKGVKGLPVLQGRQGRLAALEKPLLEQLNELSDREGLEQQSAVLRLRIAEVILATGDAIRGQEALALALEKGEAYLDAEDVAKARLRWLLLLSAIHLVKGRQAEGGNDTKKALTEYYESLRIYQKLGREHPESPAIYFTLGRVYLAAGNIAAGAGAVNDASTLRGYAAQHFLKLSEKGEKTPEIEYQIASATAAQAVAKWQQGKIFEAEKLASEGLGKLNALLAKMPNDFRVITDLASQQGIVATALRDEGKSSQAEKILRQAINSLGGAIEEHPKDLSAKYLLASLKWQMSGLLGQQGGGEEEIILGIDARDALREILASNKKVPHPYLVKKSLAYLCGDLGHSVELHGDRDLGIELLQDAKVYWKELLQVRPNSAENLEGMRWVVQNLHELGVD